MSTKAKRELFPDVLRVFAAILVILLHAQTSYNVSSANFGRPLWWVTMYVGELTRVGVPLFFMISGYLLLSSRDCDDILPFYKKRFSKLAIPFAVATVGYYLYYCLINGKAVFSMNFFRELTNTGTAYHLWYLYSLGMLYLFMPFFKAVIRFSEENGSKMILVLFLVLVTWQPTIKPLLNTITSGFLYINFSADGVVGYFGYALLGYILGKYSIPKKLSAVIYSLGALSFVVIPILSGMRIIDSGDFLWNGGYTVNHYIEAAAVFLAAKSLFASEKTESCPRFSNGITYLSGLTLNVYLVHVIVLDGMEYITSRLFSFMPPWLSISFITVAVTFISFGISALWYELFTKRIRAKKKAS